MAWVLEMPSDIEPLVELIQASGKYKIIEQNEEGMNAYAFRALHNHLGCEVFLKVYSVGDDENGSNIFAEPQTLVEATARDQGSVHIVRVLDADMLSDEWVLFAMELIDGGSLLKLIESGPISLCEAIEIAKGILHGLSYLHQGLLVHRDLKPANLLVACSEGQPSVPKICDFGSVSKLSEEGGSVSASRHSALYVPPEGWDDGEYCVPSDIYQVGLLLSELINGPLPRLDSDYLDREAKREIRVSGSKSLDDLDPFEHSQVVDRSISRRASGGKIYTLLNERPYIGQALKRVINIALAVNKNDRYQTATEMISALNQLSCPNWLPVENEYIALDWRDWDWKIVEVNKRAGTTYVVKRSRRNQQSFRRYGETHLQLKKAFACAQSG